MKKISTTSKELTQQKNSLSREKNYLQNYSPYPVKKSFNIFKFSIAVILLASAFIFGRFSNDSKLNTSTTTYRHEINETLPELQYKKISFKNYLDKLNEVKFKDYRDYLTEQSRIRREFDSDMDYNRKVFVATHDILGNDKIKYHNFLHKHSQTKNEFRRELDKSNNLYRSHLRAKRKISSFMKN